MPRSIVIQSSASHGNPWGPAVNSFINRNHPGSRNTTTGSLCLTSPHSWSSDAHARSARQRRARCTDLWWRHQLHEPMHTRRQPVTSYSTIGDISPFSLKGGHCYDFSDDDDRLDRDDGFNDSFEVDAGAGLLRMAQLCGRRRGPRSNRPNRVCKLQKRDAAWRGMGIGLHGRGRRGTSFMMTADRLDAMWRERE